MHSPRLRYRPVDADDVDALLRLVTDAHVKQYLFDGETVGRDWCKGAIATSRRSFETHGVGLWLVQPAGSDSPVGFCGYWVFEELGPELQLLYAFTAQHAGSGYATEAARALVEDARRAGMSEIVAAVDEPNTASVRVLEKVGLCELEPHRVRSAARSCSDCSYEARLSAILAPRTGSPLLDEHE